MSDDLVIRGGGSGKVSTEYMADLSARFGRSATSGHRLGGDLVWTIQNLTREPGSTGAIHSIRQAEKQLQSAIVASEGIVDAVNKAAEAYGFADRAANQMMQTAAGAAAWVVGRLATMMIPTSPMMLEVVPGAVVGLLAVTVAWAALTDKERTRIKDQLISDPRFVTALRLMIGSADNALSGFRGLSPEVAYLLGDEGLGVTGLAATTAALLAVTPIRESDVSVKESKSKQVVAPAGIDERTGNIPLEADQIRIDRYEGEPPRFDVYVGGTKEFKVFGGPEPFDMTSNLYGVAGQGAGSERAVQQAMALAGVQPGDPVIFSGYSQGALIAARLAESGDYNAVGLLTIGGPDGGVKVPASVPWLVVEHTDDLVPATGGPMLSPDAVVASRRAIDEESDLGNFPVPAHDIKLYRETTVLIDRSQESRVSAITAKFADFGGTGVATSTTYRATRVG